MLSLENDFRSFRRYPWINDCNAGGVLVNSWCVSADNYLSRLPPIEKSDAMLVIAAGGTVLLNSRHWGISMNKDLAKEIELRL